jgi:hypothetical protein
MQLTANNSAHVIVLGCMEQKQEYTNYVLAWRVLSSGDIVLCSIVEVHLHFSRIYCIHSQGQRESQASNDQDIDLLILLFDPGDEGSIFLRNTGELILDYMT